MEINKQVIGIAAGVLGSLFVGYCIYFDHKRRVDPEYKKKVRDREYLSTVQSQGLVYLLIGPPISHVFAGRRKAKKHASGRSEMPNMIDKNAVQT